MRWIGDCFTQPLEDESALAYWAGDRIVEIDFYVRDEPPGNDDEIELGWLTL